MLRVWLLAVFLSVPGLAFAETVQAWLLLSADWRESLLSTDLGEKDSLLKTGWKLNGTGNLQAQAEKGAAPLHRLARPGSDATDRYLEYDAAEVEKHVKAGFADEGQLGFVAIKEKTGLVPVHHFQKGEGHLWLIDLTDQSAAEKQGWKNEGVSFWLWPVRTTAIAPAAAAKSVK